MDVNETNLELHMTGTTFELGLQGFLLLILMQDTLEFSVMANNSS